MYQKGGACPYAQEGYSPLSKSIYRTIFHGWFSLVLFLVIESHTPCLR
jgi:hypothetical protein